MSTSTAATPGWPSREQRWIVFGGTHTSQAMPSVLGHALVAIITTTAAANQQEPSTVSAPAPEAATPSNPTASASEDVVHLESGGFVRGVVEEYEPGGQVVLRRPDGSVRTFSAAEVDRVAIGGASAPEPAVTPREPTPPPTPASTEGAKLSASQARVHLVRVGKGPTDLVLHRKTGGVFVSGAGGSAAGLSWENSCSAPCGRPISTNGVYFVNGANTGAALASRSVNLDAYRGRDVTLQVKGGRPGILIGGYMLTLVGGTTAAIAPLWFINDNMNNAVGATMLATGTGALIGGIIMWARGRNRVTLVPGRPK